MMKFAVALERPAAVRYPRGTAYAGLQEFRAPIELGKSEMLYQGSEVAIFAVGSMVKTAVEVRELLLEQGINPTVVNGRFIKPIDEEAIKEACKTHKLIVTLEENVASGGYGEAVASYMKQSGYENDLYLAAIPDRFIEHGSVPQLMEEIQMDAPCIAKGIVERIR